MTRNKDADGNGGVCIQKKTAVIYKQRGGILAGHGLKSK